MRVIHTSPGVQVVEHSTQTLVHIKADKIPNVHNYGHTVESGTSTRWYARLAAREHISEAADVTACLDTYYTGGDFWRVYGVTA